MLTSLTPEAQLQLSEPIGRCRNCGHSAMNHFAKNSIVKRGCMEKECNCDWRWDGMNETVGTKHI